MSPYQVNPDLSTQGVFDILRTSGKPLEEWGRAVDGTPMLAARTGGDKLPAIFITAGVHSDETAGIHAALSLLDRLDTDHEVHVLPLRDPYGFAGVDHCLSFAGGEHVHVSNHAEALEYLKKKAELVWCRGEMAVFKLGEIGFVWNPLTHGLDGFWDMFNAMTELSKTAPQALAPLLGKSMMLINPDVNSEGAAEMTRCWHSYLSQQGEWLHLNRFFGRADAPPEVAAVDRLMLTVRPGLTCDLHEGNGQGFWMPLPKPEKEVDRVLKMAGAYFDYIASRGYPITTYDNWLATDRTNAASLEWMQPEPRLAPVFWTKASLKGEGPNLVEYADRIGIAYGTEGPLMLPLDWRVDGITNGILASIKVWEATLHGSD